MPELCSSTSMGLPSNLSARSCTDSSSVTSKRCTTTVGSCAAYCFNSVLCSGCRDVASTSQPSVAYWLANSRPRPRFAPVIRIVDMFTNSSAPSGNHSVHWKSCGLHQAKGGFSALHWMLRAENCYENTSSRSCELHVGKMRINCDGMCSEFNRSSNIACFSNDPQKIAPYTHLRKYRQGHTNNGFPPIHSSHHHNKT